jgi:hypothetical protein
VGIEHHVEMGRVIVEVVVEVVVTVQSIKSIEFSVKVICCGKAQFKGNRLEIEEREIKQQCVAHRNMVFPDVFIHFNKLYNDCIWVQIGA